MTGKSAGTKPALPAQDKWEFEVTPCLWMSAMIGYRVSEMVSLGAGYRALNIDYESGSGNSKFVYDMTFQGPVLGVGFRF